MRKHVTATYAEWQQRLLAAPGSAPQGNTRGSYRICKRLLDCTLAGAAIVLLAPALAVIALLVRFGSAGPALYKQQRVGKQGEIFTMLKFRTMYVSHDDSIHRDAFQRFFLGQPFNEASSNLLLFKLQSDPRVTPFGRFLRRTSLDELPQLWNVLRGEMSLVGPRPPIPYEAEHYSARHWRRLSVSPGLTGLWQVRGRSRVTFEEMVELDLEYIAAQSLLFDLKLLAATIPVLMGGKGGA